MNVVKSNIDVLVKEGLGPRADTDFLLARDTCLALLKLGVAKTVSSHIVMMINCLYHVSPLYHTFILSSIANAT